MYETSNALWKAADETLDTMNKHNRQKKQQHPDIKAIFDERQRAVNDFNQQEIRRLTNKLKRKAEQIRSKRIVDSLEEGKLGPGHARKERVRTSTCKGQKRRRTNRRRQGKGRYICRVL